MKDITNKDIYSAAILIIGNEILSGRTVDTNACWIAEELMGKGIKIVQIRTVPDIEEEIVDSVTELRQKVDYVFSTGGIGPTHDDITARAISKAFDVELAFNQEAYSMLESYYGEGNVSESQKKMAYIPAGAELIHNKVSGAPGFAVENVFVMAGIPKVMRAMFEHVVSMIKLGKPLLSNTIACSLQESLVALELSDLQNRHQEVEIGSYPHYRGGILGLSIVLRSTDSNKLSKATEELLQLIKKHGVEPTAISSKTSSSINIDDE